MKLNSKTIYFFALGILSIAVDNSAIAAPPARGEDQVTICHIPPGNPGNAHTITVGISAVDTHISQHGDTIGPCATSADDCDSCGYSDADYSTEGSCVSTCGILMK